MNVISRSISDPSSKRMDYTNWYDFGYEFEKIRGHAAIVIRIFELNLVGTSNMILKNERILQQLDSLCVYV